MTASRWILGGLAACLLVLPANSGFAKPPKPGPDYEWEQHHTTPEGHYVPGRWIRKKKVDAAPVEPPPPYKAGAKPGAHWMPPSYNPAQAPLVPQTYIAPSYVPPTYVPDATVALVAPLAGLYLYHPLGSSYSWHYRTHPYTYDHGPYYKPHAWVPGKPLDPYPWHTPTHHAPLKVPHGKGDHKAPYKGSFTPPFKDHKGLPSKSIKGLPGKTDGKHLPLGKAIVGGSKDGKLEPGKK